MNRDDEMSEFIFNRSTYESNLLLLLRHDRVKEDTYAKIKHISHRYSGLRIEKQYIRVQHGGMGIVIIGSGDHLGFVDTVNHMLAPTGMQMTCHDMWCEVVPTTTRFE